MIVRHFNGHPVTKIEKLTQNFGGVLCRSKDTLPERVMWLTELEDGFYSIKGQEFRVDSPSYSSEKEIIFPLFPKKENYISKYINFKWDNYYKNMELMGLSEEDDDYEVDCTNCGDGGCVHCDPSSYIEGYIY